MRTIICNRCGDETDNWSGTPDFKVCEECFNELQNNKDIEDE